MQAGMMVTYMDTTCCYLTAVNTTALLYVAVCPHKQRTCWAAGRVVGAIVEAKVACCTADLLGDIGYRVGREGGACGRGSRLGSVLVSAGCTSAVAAWLHCPHKRCVKAIVSLTPFGAAYRGSGGIGVVVVASGALGAAVVAAHHVCRRQARFAAATVRHDLLL